MFNLIKTQRKTAANTADITLNGIDPSSDMHQVELTGVAADLTGGEVAFFTKSVAKRSEWQPLQKDGADYSLVITAGGVRSFEIPNASIVAIEGRIVAAVTGDTEWALNIISGRK